jgi:hypothetical protein
MPAGVTNMPVPGSFALELIIMGSGEHFGQSRVRGSGPSGRLASRPGPLVRPGAVIAGCGR